MYNTGQTAVFLKNLTGREYPAIAEVNRKKRVNGQREISLSFLYTEINKDFMDDIEFGWKVLFKDEWYTITHPGYSTDGDYFTVNVTAVLSFFVDLNGYFMQDKAEDKSITPAAYFGNLFQGTPYSYVLVDNLTANTVSYQDNESRTARFLYGIERFSAEYTVRGNVVYIYKLVGSDKDVILHEDLNINSVRMEVDASGFHTWAKGFGDLPEQEGDEEPEYQLEVEYISPLAAKYGMIEGPAIKDGKYKQADSLTEAVKNQVENSYLISTEIDAIDLTNNGYPEMNLEEGDRIWLYVNRLKLNQQVRIVELDETFDWEGNIIAARYTAGNEGIAARYKADQYDTFDDFDDITSGRKPIEYDWLPDAIKRASEIINGNQDSLFRYLPGEIIGINQSNPNGYMRFNTDGLGFSRDGGKTYKSAITYEGIVAESIVGGSIIGVNISSFDEKGMFHVNGADAEFLDLINNRSVKISPDGLFGYNSGGSERFRMDRLLVTSAALGTSNSNVYLAPDSNNEARVVDLASIPSDGAAESYNYLPIRALGYRFKPGLHGYIGVDTDMEVRITSLGFRQEDGSVIYRALRAQGFYGDYLDINNTATGANLYARPANEGELRVTRIGTTDDYRPVRASGFLGTYIDRSPHTEGSHLYVRPAGDPGEVRITVRSTTDTWRPLRASGFYGNHIDINDLTGGVHMYIRPASTGMVKVTQAGTDDVYKPIEASDFITRSNAVAKKNIENYTGNALHEINTTPIREFHLLEDLDNEKKRIGVIVQESPADIVDITGEGVSDYAMVSMAWKGIQELSAENTALKLRVDTLETDNALLKQENQLLKQENEVLKQRLDLIEQRLSALEA